ncbi:Periplasmic beta-glucosidase [Bosea sp. 62]|uniref:glycoside hydrolase family 3 N-terminal domain-containing protein n=1 Tax=unclassified Bosea (in: a-proteobacteria) TaxID=2653178 RepID=UPI001250EC27|nr:MULTISPECIES: glycoside hydrolase family 3 N-terminal domain-containing protein [unclassified Bosea (in: a-proteobacteria)]CAD5246078.1 Periplasmic beta-glucosidase [Bosea sp. 7B]CAD5247714.1 Periplasmic beta-glucosidase [Bosea sp. 21B]CAD5270165.1 Periplasmic beta-glucosidase [Bosea sp. 46]VVT50985.1 Periplasmic beta-glucosidase [Bosea sp. EC-HK365B]VXA93818.1 Periplasmic beta-glucosidase [Bosea sp. 127]
MLLRLVAAFLFCGLATFAHAQQEGVGWKQGREAAEIERKITALIGRMTLEEKVGQLHLSGRGEGFDINQVKAGRMGAVMNFVVPQEVRQVQEAVRQSRLKIPLIIGLDAVHGFSTYFPLPLGQASSWNPQLIEQAAYWTGREARAAGVNWTFAPMVDISRDPRWGRVLEGAGEDAYLASIIAVARTRGYQRGGVAASVKHFVGYGAAEGGRDYNSTWIPTSQLHDLFLPPFKAAFDTGAMTAMAAFNALNGMPATAHRGMLTDLLRGQWGFRGFVTSDFGSITELRLHGIAKDDAEAARKALLAGIDMDMMGDVYHKHLANEVKAGRVPVKALDEAVRRVLRVKYHLGLFERADVDVAAAPSLMQTEEARKVARQAAREGVILLRNDKQTLPIAPAVKSVAVIGAMAVPEDERVWTDPAGLGRRVVQPLPEALREQLPADVTVTYEPAFAKACGTEFKDKDAALKAAAAADLIVTMLGEDCEFMGEGASRTNLGLPGVQQELLEALVATGKPVVLVLATGRPLVLSWADKNVAAIVQTFHGGTEGRAAIAEVLAGKVNPAGRTPMSFPRSVGQIPVYYDQLPTGRPQKIRQRYESIYMDEANEALYPFGFGLSYSRFAYANPRVTNARVPFDGATEVAVDVTNQGDRDGQEVVQLYIRQPVAERSRPLRLLKGFDKVALKAGETRTVRFKLEGKALGGHDDAGRYQLDPGTVEVYFGGSSLASVKAQFELTKR